MTTKVLLTGASGFLGRHILPALCDAYGEEHVTGVSSKHYDLTMPNGVDQMLAEQKPEILVHFAGSSGGIGAHRAYPADLYFRNTLVTALVFEAAARHRVKKIVYPIGSCSYPAQATSPLIEEQLWTGPPQLDTEAYSAAKLLAIIAAKAYRQQHGVETIILVLGNVYGEYASFAELESQVVQATIRRFFEARLNAIDAVSMWGSGKPKRDFVYAGDVARILPFIIDRYSDSSPLNIASGKAISIRELAETIGELVGFTGRIFWNRDKPDGHIMKLFDVTRLRALGLSCDTPLRIGLQLTIDWFEKNYVSRKDGLRL